MAFQSVILHIAKTLGVSNIAPYYGLNSATLATPTMILSLSFRGTVGSVVADFTLEASANEYFWWASPVSLGRVQFLDVDSGFIGGWDGANNDFENVFGPRVIEINGINFYTYRTDWNGLGLCHWKSSTEI